MGFPSRFVHVEEARARWGDRALRLGAMLSEGDPLADAAVLALRAVPDGQRMVDRALVGGIASVPEAPEALRALFAQLDTVPFWVDLPRVHRGARAMLRSGHLGGIVLGAYSLLAGYCSPGGNKPLTFSGRLASDAARRLAETSRFVQAVSAPGGVARDGDGFAALVKVRLMHASVRVGLLRSPKWNSAAWGVPINQYDMSGTALLFSFIVLDGLDKLGFATTPDERADFLHLWRYAAYVLGVCDELRCATEDECRTLWEMLESTQAPPDDDARMLANALLDSGLATARTPAERRRAETVRTAGHVFARHLLGDDLADALGIRRSPAGAALRWLQRLNARTGGAVGRGARLSYDSSERGERYWQGIVALGLRGTPATFALP